jgi:hypothetical protein
MALKCEQSDAPNRRSAARRFSISPAIVIAYRCAWQMGPGQTGVLADAAVNSTIPLPLPADFARKRGKGPPRQTEKAPGRLTAGALAAPFSPGGSIRATTQTIS